MRKREDAAPVGQLGGVIKGSRDCGLYSTNFPAPGGARQHAPLRGFNWPPRNQAAWNRVAMARSMPRLLAALDGLVPKLLKRGTGPDVVARDLALLVGSCNAFDGRVWMADAVAPVVHAEACAFARQGAA